MQSEQQELVQMQQQQEQKRQEHLRHQKQQIAYRQTQARIFANNELATYLMQTLQLLLIRFGVFGICSPLALHTHIVALEIIIFWMIFVSIFVSIFVWIFEPISKSLGIWGIILGAILGTIVVMIEGRNLEDMLNTTEPMFMYEPFLIGIILVAILLIMYFIREYKSHFFILLEQIVWLYSLNVIISHCCFVWRFSGQFSSLLLPTPLLILLTIAVTALYLIRLVMRYRTLVNNRI